MEVAVDVAPPGAPGADLLGVFVTQPPIPLRGQAEGLDASLRGRLARLAGDGELTGELGSSVVVHLDGDPAQRVAAAGVGGIAEADADAVRTAAAAAVQSTRKVVRHVAWLLDEALPLPVDEQARAVVEGALLGAYDPGLWKTDGDGRGKLERLTLVTQDGDRLRPVVERAAAVARRVNRARDLANAPPNELTPERLAAHAAEIARAVEHVSVDALGPEEIRRHSMGAFAAVAQGSHNPPRLVVMRYDPPAPARNDLVLGLVGKAITFDTGGISLKPHLYMEDMKGDMAGGAAVVEAVGALADVGVPLRALAVVAATENMVGGGAYRPGDILRAANGKTIEVVNTDAEGRLVLADALWYARREGATHLLDLATLTGAMERAMGDLYAGVFANDASWRDEVVAAGEASGDHAWPWPLHRRYRRYIDSAFADMKNVSVRGQAIPAYAGEFLQEFAGDGPWAHVDIAGTGFLTWPRPDYLSQRGGTGYGVRMIVELATRLANA